MVTPFLQIKIIHSPYKTKNPQYTAYIKDFLLFYHKKPDSQIKIYSLEIFNSNSFLGHMAALFNLDLYE